MAPSRGSWVVDVNEIGLDRRRAGDALTGNAFTATGMALTAGPIARSKTGEHDPPFSN